MAVVTQATNEEGQKKKKIGRLFRKKVAKVKELLM